MEDLPYICVDRGMVYFRKRGRRKVRIRERRGTAAFHRRYAGCSSRAGMGSRSRRPAVLRQRGPGDGCALSTSFRKPDWRPSIQQPNGCAAR